MSSVKTYAEVGRILAHMRETGMSPNLIAERRSALYVLVAARYRRADSCKRSMPVVAPERLDALAEDVARACGVDPRMIYRPKRRGVAGVARRAFVVAACALGYCYVELANYLRKPAAHSSVQYLHKAAGPDECAIANAALLRDKQREAARRLLAAQPAQEASAA